MGVACGVPAGIWADRIHLTLLVLGDVVETAGKMAVQILVQQMEDCWIGSRIGCWIETWYHAASQASRLGPSRQGTPSQATAR